MLKRVVLLTIFLLSFLTVFANDANKFSGSLLWKISGNGLSSPSYLLGTHHLTSGSYTDSIPGFKEAFASTQQVVGEILLGDKQAVQMQIVKFMQMPDSVKYMDLLTGEEYDRLDKMLKEKMGAGLDQLGLLKPFMINLSFSMMLYSQLFPDIDFTKLVAIDDYVQQLAKEQGKSLKGLESVEFQLSIFETDPLSVQAQELLCAMEHTDYMIDVTRKLSTYYATANLSAMAELADDESFPCPMSKEMEHKMLKERNDNWLIQLPKLMKDKPAFVAVGALHLVGEDGLLYQLEKLGYTVTPVR